MAHQTCGDISADLAKTQRQFRDWRDSRKRGARIPEKLWDLAVGLAHTHSVARIASLLKLDYYALQKRLRSKNPGGGRHPPSTPTFIELGPLPQAAPAECVIELEDSAGARMRVQLKGYHAADVAALGRTFWETQKCCKSRRK